jgi:fucose 4-O-acetylase-like acetyltransferase
LNFGEILPVPADSSRIRFIDVAKGFTILLVAINHNPYLRTAVGPTLVAILGLVRLPFFFFLSGLFLNFNREGLIGKKFRSLIKPYFAATILFTIIYGASEGEPIRQLIGALYANGSSIIDVPIWFLPHLFLTILVAVLIFRVFKLGQGITFKSGLVLMAQFAAGAALIGIVPVVQLAGYPFQWLPWGLDIVLLSSFFLLLGQLLRQQVFTFKVNAPLVVVAFFTFLLVATLTNARLDLDHRKLINPAAVLLAALSGILLFLAIAKAVTRIEPLAAFFAFTGRASLVILIFHYPFWDLALELFPQSFRQHTPAWFGFATYVISIGLSMLTYLAIDRWPIIRGLLLPNGRGTDQQPAQ